MSYDGWLKISCVALVCAALSAFCFAAEWHVAPDGSPDGDGGVDNPWDIQTAMLHPEQVKPGDTIWIHGGVYEPDGAIRVRLQGEEDAPIIVRNWNNERVTLHAQLDIATTQRVPTRHVWIWGLEVQTAGTRNPGNPANIGSSSFEPAFNPGIKLINCVFHNSPGNGLGNWGSAEEEVYGCIIYNNGSDGNLEDPAARGHGHGFYIQSMTGKEFRDNIVFRQFFLGFQIYGTARARMVNVTMEGNTFFNNGEMSLIQRGKREFPVMHIGGGSPIVNPKVIENYVYSPAWAVKSTSNMGGSVNGIVRGNYLVAPRPDRRVALDLGSLGPNENIAVEDNTFIGMIAGFELNEHGEGNVHIPERPTEGKAIFVRPNQYEKGRANITIFNWALDETVEVDISEAGLEIGDAYEVRDVQNFFADPVVEGVYDGEPITIPMTGLTVADPIGRPEAYTAPEHTAPEFGAFVLLPVPAE